MLALSIVATSCEKAPFLTLSTPKTINFTDQGGTQSITFTANRDWSVSSSDSWCKVSPSSGNKADGNITVTLTCEPNTTYDSRSATLTVRVEELSETITVTQDTNLGLLVSPTSYDLTNAAQSIEVEVRANVKYTVEIDAACKDWISQTGTKALSTEKITFSIAANESYDNREGKITIKQTDGNLSETIVVKQSQTNGLFITTPEYDLSNEEHTLSVEVKANVSFQVSPQVDWIKYVETKALTSSTIVLSIEANATYDDRTGTVLVKQTNGDLSGTITINQKQTDGLFVTPTDVDVDNAEHTVELEVKNNVSYDVVIPDDAKEWISIKSNTATKALAENKVTLAIAQNTTYDNREASITIKQTDGALAETVKIKQAQTDGLFITTPEYNLSNESHTLSVEVQANVSFEVTPEAEWIHYVQTKALNSSTITLTIDANETYDARTGKVSVKQSNGNLTGEITVNQAEKYGLFVSPEEFNLTKDEQTINVEVKYNVEYDVMIPDAAKDWVSIQSTPPTKGLTTETVTFAIAENKAYTSRETAIAFKQKDGDLTGTVKITQDQTDYLSITPQKDSLIYQGGISGFSVITNIEYSIALVQGSEWASIGEKTTKGTNDGLTTFEYSISAPENETIVARYAVIDVNNSSGETLQSFILAQGPQPIVEFDDDKFKNYCLTNFDTNADGEVSYKEASTVDYIWCPQSGIKSLKGIEHFPSLVTLSCELNKLSTLDVSGNPLLKDLYCSRNFINSLDFSNNPKIETIYCVGNGLQSIVLTNCTALSHLECQENKLNEINLSECTSLKILYVDQNNLTTINLSNNSLLHTISCCSCHFTVLDFSHNLDLTFADCLANPLTEIILKVGQQINFLRYSYNPTITYVE